MKNFDKDDQNQTKDKTITIPSIKKEVLLMLCVLAATLNEYGAKDPHRRQGSTSAPRAIAQRLQRCEQLRCTSRHEQNQDGADGSAARRSEVLTAPSSTTAPCRPPRAEVGR